MSYAIEAAWLAEGIDRVFLSTDSADYAKLAQDLNPHVEIIMRPKHLAADVPTELVLQHAVTYLKEHDEYPFDEVVTLQCTTPLMQSSDIEACIKKLNSVPFDMSNVYDSVITVTECSEHPSWMFSVTESHLYLVPYDQEVRGIQGVRQFLPTLYRPNGAVYVTTLDTLFLQNRIIGRRCGYVEMPRLRSIDIDSEEDFLLLEAIMEAGLV